MSALKPVLIVASGLVMIVAFILYTVSNALPSWGTVDVGLPVKSGLWQGCAKYLGEWVCGNIDCQSSLLQGTTFCSKLLAARAFITLACIFSILSGISQFARLLEQIGSNRLLSLVIKALPMFALLMGIIGVAIGIPTIVEEGVQIGAAAIVGIVALVINFVGGVLAAAAP